MGMRDDEVLRRMHELLNDINEGRMTPGFRPVGEAERTELARVRTPEFAQQVVTRARGYIEAEDPGMLAQMSESEGALFFAGTIAGMQAAVTLLEEAARG